MAVIVLYVSIHVHEYVHISRVGTVVCVLSPFWALKFDFFRWLSQLNPFNIIEKVVRIIEIS